MNLTTFSLTHSNICRKTVLATLSVLSSACLSTTDTPTNMRIPTPYSADKIGVTHFDENQTYEGVVKWRCSFYDEKGKIRFETPYERCELIPEKGLIFFIGRGEIGVSRPDGVSLWKREIRSHHDFYYDQVLQEGIAVMRRKYLEEKQEVWHDGVEIFHAAGERVFLWESQNHREQISKLLAKTNQKLVDQYYIDDDQRHIGIKVNSATVLRNHPARHQVPAFRDGNVLLNLHRYRHLVVLDRNSGEILWSHYFGKEYEAGKLHSIRQLDNGHFLFFQNKVFFGITGERKIFRSQIVEWDPVKRQKVWAYPEKLEEAIYEVDGSSVFSLPNGNYMISYEDNRSAIEVTRKGDIVWEWFPPSYTGNRNFGVNEVRKIPHSEFNAFLKNARKRN